MLLLFHSCICRHCNVYQECCLVVLVWSSVLNYMIRLDIHLPEDLHTLCLYDQCSHMLVPLFRMLYVICFTESAVDSSGNFVVSVLYSSCANLLQSLIMCVTVSSLFLHTLHVASGFTFSFVYFDLDCISL